MERKKLYAIIIVILVACAIGAVLYTLPGGPPEEEEETPPSPITLANITGTVTAEDTGLPIEGAKVTLVKVDSYTTASDGVYLFSISYVMSTNYTIKTEKAGYEMKTSKVLVTEAKQYTVDFVLKLSGTSVYLDPSETILNTSEVSVGHRFNVTAWVSNVDDLMGFQVALYYDASVINMTSASLAADHVLAGQSGIPLAPRYYYFDSWGVGFVGFSGLGGMTTPFTGTGTLAVFEFEIIAAPPEGGSLTSDLVISYQPTGGPYPCKLKDSAGALIDFTAEDGYYEYIA